MLDSAMISILKTQVCFLGTSHDNVPRVRPMRPFVSEEGTVWLIRHSSASVEMLRIKMISNCKKNIIFLYLLIG